VRAAAQKAIDLDPNLGEAYGLLARCDAYTWDWKWNDAEDGISSRAIDLREPARTVRVRYGWSLATRGRFADAHTQLRLADGAGPALGNCRHSMSFLSTTWSATWQGQKQVLQLDRCSSDKSRFSWCARCWTLVMS
jgi:Tfp pilus assembly protein PilF